MKKLLFALLVLLLFSCKDDEIETGSLTVKISYLDPNGFDIEAKPDVGVDVYVFKSSGKVYNENVLDFREGALDEINMEDLATHDYRGKTDVSGTATIKGLPYGKYMVFVSSKGRENAHSATYFEMNTSTVTLVRHFFRSDYGIQPW